MSEFDKERHYYMLKYPEDYREQIASYCGAARQNLEADIARFQENQRIEKERMNNANT